MRREMVNDTPYTEPLRATLTRTLIMAAALAAAAAAWTFRAGALPGVPRAWAAYFLGFLWITLGGHWPELVFINRIRPRLPRSAGLRGAARVLLWLVCGPVLFAGGLTTFTLVGTGQPPSARHLSSAVLWGGPVFVGVELVVHSILLLRGRRNFWNGTG